MACDLMGKKALNGLSGWKRDCAVHFERAILSNNGDDFPCHLGVIAERQGWLRYSFFDGTFDDDIESLAAGLACFVENARDVGPSSSLVVFFSGPSYETRDHLMAAELLWRILNGLHTRDHKEWPRKIPRDPNHESWEFCFSGEPMYIVCSSPHYKSRLSRFGKYFSVMFQPHWIFDLILPELPAGRAIRREIRSRLDRYDLVARSRHLQEYGQAGNREWLQYYLSDDDAEVLAVCPMKEVMPDPSR